MKQILVVGILLVCLLALSCTASASTSVESSEVSFAAAPSKQQGGGSNKKLAGGVNKQQTLAAYKQAKIALKNQKANLKKLKLKYKAAKKEHRRLKKLKKDAATKKKLAQSKKDKKGLKKSIKANKKVIKQLKKKIRSLRRKLGKRGKKGGKSKRLQKKLKKLQKKYKKLKAKKAKVSQLKKGKKTLSKGQRRKAKKLSKKMKKVGKKICKVQKKLGKKCKKNQNKKKKSRKYKRFQGKKLSSKDQARLEKKLIKKRKQLNKWEKKRARLTKEIGTAPMTKRHKRRAAKQNKRINKLKKEISQIMKLLGKRETSSLAKNDPAFKANAAREKAAADLASAVTTPAGKQSLTDFNQAADRMHQMQEDALVKTKRDQELQLKAIVDKQRADQKTSEANKLSETAFNDKAKAIVQDLRDQAKEFLSKATAEKQIAAGDVVKLEEEKAKKVEQEIKDKTALAKASEVLRTAVSTAGRSALETMKKAQEESAKAIADQIRIASVKPTPIPPTTDKDRLKDDPKGPFKRNDPTGVTAHEALVRIAKMHEENKSQDFSTSQMDKLMGTTAEEIMATD